VLSEAGDRDGAIGEMIAVAAIYAHHGDSERAQAELYAVLDAEPEHAAALDMLDQLGLGAAAQGEYTEYTEEHYDSNTTTDIGEPVGSRPYDPEAPLPSYDLEGVSAAEAIATPMDYDISQLEEPDAFAAHGFPSRSDTEEGEAEDLDQYLEDVSPPAAQPQVAARAASLAPASVEGIEEVLEEAEFFAMRGLVEDARTILQDALARSPRHPLLLERLRELDGAGAESGTHELIVTDEAPLGGGEDRIFDIAASLGALDELEASTRSSRPPSSLRAVDEIDVDQVFAKFKEGVRAQVADSDSSTHYDLGVAYKEMGLLPDAINEFAIAARDAQYECTCNAMIGMIYLEQGELDKSAEGYVRALGAAQKTIDQEMSLYYDLGNVYEMKRSNAEALYYFQKIARRDPGYRDVRDRIDALKPPAIVEKPSTGNRIIATDDELEAAFDDLFESK
jgi:tetratricopeptide (TPR) repeat protein